MKIKIKYPIAQYWYGNKWPDKIIEKEIEINNKDINNFLNELYKINGTKTD